NVSKNTKEVVFDQNRKMAATSVPESESKKYRVKAGIVKKRFFQVWSTNRRSQLDWPLLQSCF
ncbi:unnamed protein product, partial [Oikopleura dioica]